MSAADEFLADMGDLGGRDSDSDFADLEEDMDVDGGWDEGGVKNEETFDSGVADGEVSVKKEAGGRKHHGVGKTEVSAEDDFLRVFNVRSVTNLVSSNQLRNHIEKINHIMAGNRKEFASPFEEDAEYEVVLQTNKFISEVDNEIAIIFKFIRDHYARKFPELESAVPNALDYARVVKKVQNEMDVTSVEMSDILPQSTIMIISVTGSATTGQKLPQEELDAVLQACDDILQLDTWKAELLHYVQSRMTYIAPNLSALVGSSVAAQLIGAAGGVVSLSKIPACNIQLLGANRRILGGFSAKATNRHVGFIMEADIMSTAPASLKKKTARELAAKARLAAGADCFGTDRAGMTGRHLLEGVKTKIEKWQEPPPAKQEKPLPAPTMRTNNKRAGRRVRKANESRRVSDLRRKQMRIKFGEQEEEIGYSGKGLGMLGQEGSGSLRATVTEKKSKIKLAKNLQRRIEREKQQATSSGTATGFTTSLSFTPVQGIELEARQERVQEANDKYFSLKGGFRTPHPRMGPPPPAS